MMRKTPLLLLSIVLLACGGAAAPSGGQGSPDDTSGGEATATPGMSWDEVLAALRAEDASAIPVEIEWEDEDGRRLIEVEFIRGQDLVERYLEPSDGSLVEEKVNDFSNEMDAQSFPPLRDALVANPIRLEDAVALARSAYDPAALVEVELTFRDGRVLVEVEVNEAEGLRVYFHDPATGDVVPQ